MLTVVSRPDSNILYMLSSWCQTRSSSGRPQKEYMRAYCGYMSWTTTDSSSGKTELFSSNYLVGQFIQTSCTCYRRRVKLDLVVLAHKKSI